MICLGSIAHAETEIVFCSDLTIIIQNEDSVPASVTSYAGGVINTDVTSHDEDYETLTTDYDDDLASDACVVVVKHDRESPRGEN